MTTKQAAPATPLPWDTGTGAHTAVGHAICADAVIIASVSGRGYPIGEGWAPESEQDAAYIVAACNAYPELVAALRWTVALLEKPNGSHNRTYQVRYEHASALLAKLGAE